MMRLLVCGSRLLKPPKKMLITREEVHRVLEELMPPVLIVGDASGVDAWAYEWTFQDHISSKIGEKGLEVKRFVADWDKFGDAAGPIRNRRMIEEGLPTIVLAFPGGDGTANMVEQAMAFGIPVLDYRRRIL